MTPLFRRVPAAAGPAGFSVRRPAGKGVLRKTGPAPAFSRDARRALRFLPARMRSRRFRMIPPAPQSHFICAACAHAAGLFCLRHRAISSAPQDHSVCCCSPGMRFSSVRTSNLSVFSMDGVSAPSGFSFFSGKSPQTCFFIKIGLFRSLLIFPASPIFFFHVHSCVFCLFSKKSDVFAALSSSFP